MKKKLLAGLLLSTALVVSACGSKVPGETVTEPAAEEAAKDWTEEVKADESTEETAETSAEAEPETEENQDTEETQEAEPEETTEAEENTADDPAEDIEKSPMALWGYEGYVDECREYYWVSDFENQDYDGDGTTDRVNRTYHEEDQKADYVIEFGNGNKLEIDGVWETGFPHIQMDDLNGDGEKDVLFTLSYDTSTDPLAFGNMLIYEYDSAAKSYNPAQLPFDKSEDEEVGGCALLVDFEAPTDNGDIAFQVKKTGYSGTVQAGSDYVSSFWTNDAASENRNVYEASIEDHNGQKAVHCNMELLHKLGAVINFYLVYENGEYVIKDMGSDDELIQGEMKDMSATDPATPAAPSETPKTGGHVVVIDPGHQAKGMSEKEPNGPGSSEMKAKVTSGTSGKTSGLAEYQLTLTIGLKLRDELQNRGYTVIMTRETHDVSLSNVDRAQIANNAGAEAFIRIHANGADDTSVNGAMTLCQTPSNPYNAVLYPQSRKLSDCVLDAYVAATGFKKRSVWETDTMTGINWANVPSTIIEMGYMSNPTDDANMANEAMQQQMVIGIANGIDNYFAQ